MNGSSCLFLYFRLFKALPISPGWVPLWGLLNLQVSLYAYLKLWGLRAALRRALQKQWPFAGSWQDTGRSARALTSPKVCSGAPGRGGSAQRPGGELEAPGPPRCPSRGDAPQDPRRLWERTSAVAGAAGARPPRRTARRPEGRVRTAAPPHSQPALPADTAASPVPYEKRRQGAHLELRLGDFAAAVQVERGEGVPDGFEQFVFQAPHGRGRAAPTDLVSPVRNSAFLPPAGSPPTTLPAARSPDRCRPRPPRGHAPLVPSHQHKPQWDTLCPLRGREEHAKSLGWVSIPTRGHFQSSHVLSKKFPPSRGTLKTGVVSLCGFCRSSRPQLLKKPWFSPGMESRSQGAR